MRTERPLLELPSIMHRRNSGVWLAMVSCMYSPMALASYIDGFAGYLILRVALPASMLLLFVAFFVRLAGGMESANVRYSFRVLAILSVLIRCFLSPN